MPFTENQAATIYWDEQGSGEPLLLIMGLSYPSYMWHRTRPLLAQNFRTIAFDNRGIGQSDVPPGVYPIAQMASDAAAVLDAANVSSAHVFGVSMGGMIAQEFTLQYPQRVRSLILGCTNAGGPHPHRANQSSNVNHSRRNGPADSRRERQTDRRAYAARATRPHSPRQPHFRNRPARDRKSRHHGISIRAVKSRAAIPFQLLIF